MLDEYPLDYYHRASFLRPSGLLGERGCATSRVRVELLSGAHGVSRCVKTKRGSLQETQGDSKIDRFRDFWTTLLTVRHREAEGSNPSPPTIFVFKIGDFRGCLESADHSRV